MSRESTDEILADRREHWLKSFSLLFVVLGLLCCGCTTGTIHRASTIRSIESPSLGRDEDGEGDVNLVAHAKDESGNDAAGVTVEVFVPHDIKVGLRHADSSTTNEEGECQIVLPRGARVLRVRAFSDSSASIESRHSKVWPVDNMSYPILVDLGSVEVAAPTLSDRLSIWAQRFDPWPSDTVDFQLHMLPQLQGETSAFRAKRFAKNRESGKFTASGLASGVYSVVIQGAAEEIWIIPDPFFVAPGQLTKVRLPSGPWDQIKVMR